VVLALEEGETVMSPAVLEPPVDETPAAPGDRPAAPGAAAPPPVYVARFDGATRWLHIVIMVTFLGLSATGMPLLFSEAGWARLLAGLFGGFHGAGILHRVFGATLLAAVAWHVVDLLYRAFVRGEKGLFWGPNSMTPQPRDLADLYGHMKWFFGLGPRPRFDHFAYWEKFDYLAVLWGTALMGAAGLVLWFPVAASRILPGWMFNVALFVHGAEASLAIGFIFVVHFFNGHLRPGKFPMDMVIFTGAVSADELRHERAAEYDRLQRTGAIDGLCVAAPTAAELRRGRIVGTIGLTLGIALVTLIIYAVSTGRPF
jgi:cytochrome b subunit of formate dehydrogenase